MIHSTLMNVTTQDEVFTHKSRHTGNMRIWTVVQKIKDRAIKCSMLEVEDLYRLTVRINEKSAQMSFKGDGTVVSESEW